MCSAELFIQHDIGHLSGRDASTPLSSLEFAVAQFEPKVLLVLADGTSEHVGAALDQARGGKPRADDPMQHVIDRTLVSAVRVMRQAERAADAAEPAPSRAASEEREQQLVVELDAFYTIEQLLRASPILRRAVNDARLELHAAVLDKADGSVAFLGEHPALSALLEEIRGE